MYVIRKDGIAATLTESEHTTKEEALNFMRKKQYLAVLLEGRIIFADTNPFTKQLGRLRVLESVPDSARLFTETDVAIKDVLFYFEGVFGMNSKKSFIQGFTLLS